MAISQPLNHIRRGAILADDADDKAGAGMAAWHDQRVTNARPHYGARSDDAGFVIIASPTIRVPKSLSGPTSGVTG